MLLIPVNTYFIMWNHLKYWSTLPTTISLIYNAIISLLILIGFNFLIQRLTPRFALRHGEFMTIYVMLAVSSALAWPPSVGLSWYCSRSIFRTGSTYLRPL